VTVQARFAPSAIWAHLRSTYWFLPSVITLACMGLAFGLTAVERNMWDRDTLPAWLTGGGSDGARQMLSAVAGSMITVVSVTFSVTIVALTVASQHFGPRLLNSFMRDTSAQAVLGIFIGTFAYCLVVLRTVRGDGDEYERFIPHVGVTVALALSLVSVGALIYYIHHVAASLQVSEIARRVSGDLLRSIDRLYPQQLGDDAEAPENPPAVPQGAVEILSTGSGYLQQVEPDQVFQLAKEAALVLWLKVRPGDFATEGLPLAVAHPPPANPEQFTKALNAALVLGTDRTSDQDAGFALQQLTEVTLHALSTGMNEPFTALTCIDRIGEGLARLVTRRVPSALRADEGGQVRVITRHYRFPELLEEAVDPIRAHGGGSPEVGKHLLVLLGRLARLAGREEDRTAIRRQAKLVKDSMERWLKDGSYGDQIENLYRMVQHTTRPLA
jgi:uncharacterized membrane protein